jgi:hypothetical protein
LEDRPSDPQTQGYRQSNAAEADKHIGNDNGVPLKPFAMPGQFDAHITDNSSSQLLHSGPVSLLQGMEPFE